MPICVNIIGTKVLVSTEEISAVVGLNWIDLIRFYEKTNSLFFFYTTNFFEEKKDSSKVKRKNIIEKSENKEEIYMLEKIKMVKYWNVM